MAHSYFHAVSSAKRWGGEPEAYLSIHNWLDDTKSSWADIRHRALRHHSFGVFECEQKFGVTILNSLGRPVPTRLIAEQHIIEDLGRIPSVQDWLSGLPVATWMFSKTKPSKILTSGNDDNTQRAIATHSEELPVAETRESDVSGLG